MKPITEPVRAAAFEGDLFRLCENVTDNWLLGLRESNPALLDMFRYDDDCCVRDKLSWSGEFPGKYLTSCCAVYGVTGNGRLLEEARRVADKLLSYQKENGYLGVWGNGFQLTGFGRFVTENGTEIRKDTWDAWSHYHMMTGLLALYDWTAEEKYLESVLKIADLFVSLFYDPKQEKPLRLADTGCLFANLAPVHIMAKLYNRTKNEKYLQFALEAEKDIASPDSIDFINNARNGNEFYQCRGVPRWEYIHSVEALAELYYATGKDEYRQLFIQIWRSIQKTDVHNTGAFSTFEQAMGTPYCCDRAIETCCVVAHTALTLDMLALTNGPEAADQLERALFNTTFGSFNPTGRWATYNTPMMGYKRAHYHEIAFQCKPGAPELNCCSVNAPRPLGMVSEWAYRKGTDGIYVNYYGPSEAWCGDLRIVQETDYPYADTVTIRTEGTGTLFLRIPAWSAHTLLNVDGKTLTPAPGYCRVDCSGKNDLQLRLDFTPRIEYGHEQLEGKRCLYVGPVLLCLDGSLTSSPSDASGSVTDISSVRIRKQPLGAFYDLTVPDGILTFCDLILAGSGGSYYTTWF